MKNWAGNYTYNSSSLFQPHTVEEIINIIKQHPRLKVLGTRHCFNDIADSKDHFLSLSHLNKIVGIAAPTPGINAASGPAPAPADAAFLRAPAPAGTPASPDSTPTVTIEAGVQYGELATWLNDRGYALHNLASLPHISVAGGCATATHGSGILNGNLSSAVAAMEMLTATGEIVAWSREKDPEEFPGVIVHLGGLGVITKMSLSIQPAYQVRQFVYEGLHLSQLEDNFEEIMSAGYSVSLFTDWRNKNINEVWIKARVGEGTHWQEHGDFFGATAATRDLHPISNISPENCTEQMGVPGPWHERLPHFRMGFTPSSGTELQSEYFVPRERSREAIRAVEQLHEKISPHLLISEIRCIAADDCWMSPCYRQPCTAIHFTWQQDWPAVSRLLPMIERQLAPFGARPHWGKLFTMPHKRIAALYEKLPDFQRLVKKYDPTGKFRNDYLDTVIFGAAATGSRDFTPAT
jgi:xylitol oxidase